MNSVLNSSQVARNDLEMGLIQDLWARHPNPVEVIPVVFDLRSPGPLSWHLTQEEGDAVLKGWDDCQQRRLEAAHRAALGEASAMRRDAGDVHQECGQATTVAALRK
jgi:hypothetical protein